MARVLLFLESVRLLFKIVRKLILLAMLLAMAGYMAKYGYKFAMKVAGVPQVSTEESDLMSTVFESAVKLVTGSAKKDQLASELSEKLYAGRASSQEMKELGIEMVRPGGSPVGASPSATQNATPATSSSTSLEAALKSSGSPAPTSALEAALKSSGSPAPAAGTQPPSLDDLKKKIPVTVLAKIWDKLRDDRVGMCLIPAAFVGMIAVRKIRGKPSKMDDLLPSILAMQNSNDAESDTMQHAVHALRSEDFELLIALIYQRQGYRVSMSAGQSGGRGGDFILARKAERLLVQCKKLACEHRIAVERVREFHEAMVTAGFTKGMYVASCGYSWDARHFAKTKGITLINARVLDQLLTAAVETPDEDLLAIARWAPKLMQKVALTPALCPACDATMDEIVANGQPVWLCSQRPDCRGRRVARKRWKSALSTAPAATDVKPTPQAASEIASTRSAAAPGEAKPAVQRSAPGKPVSSRRLNFQKVASRRIAPKPARRETPPPVQDIPAPAPAAATEECRPAALKSVVPRQRPLEKKGPDRAAFDLLRNVPATAQAPAALDYRRTRPSQA